MKRAYSGSSTSSSPSKYRKDKLVGYVQQMIVSPKKGVSGKNFRFLIQTGEKEVKKAICYDMSKKPKVCESVNKGSPVKIQNLTVNDLPADSPLVSVILNERSILSTAEKSEVSVERSEVNEVLRLTPTGKITFTGAGEYLSVEGFLQLSENEVEEQMVYGEIKQMLSGNLIYDEFGKAIPITILGRPY